MDHRKLVVGRGPRHVQALVVEEILRTAPTTPEDLGPPIRVIVPSEALRRHLLTVLMRERGRALAGVVVQTLGGAAAEILRGSCLPLPRGEAAYQVLVRRHAADEPVLQAGLGGIEGGFDNVVATVRDLLDAGFEPVHEDALLEQLEAIISPVVTVRRLQRAAAIIRVAAAVESEARRLHLGRTSTLLRQAAELVLTGAVVFPCRLVLVHGFADATGVAADLIESLLKAFSGSVFLDRPPDPAHPERTDAGASFLDRFALRFSGFDLHDECPEEAAPSGPVRRVVVLEGAPQPEAEVRRVAQSIRELIEQGTEDENIAVVARDLSAYAGSLVRTFERYGIPFSGVGTRLASGSPRRRARALADLLRQGASASVDSWLAALSLPSASKVELGLGVRHLGLSRLADLAELPVELLGVKGPTLGVAEVDQNEDGQRLRSRVLEVERLAEEAARAAEFATALADWPDDVGSSEHLRHTLQFLDLLGSEGVTGEHDDLRVAFEEAAQDLTDRFAMAAEEWKSVVAEILDHWGDQDLGGVGAGVQVLSVMEARALCFDHLFVLGMNRDHFPRVIVEDALLPDAVRGRLQPELPDIPIKSRAWSEESYLFAQLLASSDAVICSWSATRNGKSAAKSPFIERLAGAGEIRCPPDGDVAAPVLPAFETAVIAAQGAPREELIGLTAAAVAEGRQRAGFDISLVTAAELAAARIDLLGVVEPEISEARPSPFWGFTGTGCETPVQSVTLFEDVARCPWRALVVRRLGVKIAPDAAVEFPGFDTRVVGEVVHRSLQVIVEEALGETVRSLARATTRDPVPVPWPDADRLAAVVEDAAVHVLRRQRLFGKSARQLLTETALPYVEVERQVEWGSAATAPQALGAEVTGVVEIDDPVVSLAFRADRVDEVDGHLVFVDYKASAPIDASAKKEETRHRKVMARLASGRLLQAAAYVQAPTSGAALGRYSYLKPGIKLAAEEARIAELSAEDEAVARSFREAVRAIDEAWRCGACFPRVDPAGGKGKASWCDHCDIREACIRGDTEQRRRLSGWMDADRGRDVADRAVAAARRLWWLGTDE